MNFVCGVESNVIMYLIYACINCIRLDSCYVMYDQNVVHVSRVYSAMFCVSMSCFMRMSS